MDESTNNFESQIDVLSKIDKLRQDKIAKELLNQSNSLPNVSISRNEHQNNKKSLKSDVKKTSIFVNKLRSMNSEALTQCIRDVETFNLTLYISEIVAAILEINFKPTDVSLIVKLCIALHKRYEDFTPPLVDKLRQSLFTANVSNQNRDNNNEDPQSLLKKKRIQVRLMIELFESGIFREEIFFINLLKVLSGKSISTNKLSAGQPQIKRQVDLMSISTFVKYGSETLLGLPTKTIKNLSRLSNQDINDATIARFTSNNVSVELKSMIIEIFQQVCTELVKSHKEYKKKEKKAETDRLIHGSLTDEKRLEFEAVKKNFERLYSVATGLAESLGEDIPVLEEDQDDEALLSEGNSSKGISVWDGGSGNTIEYIGPFTDPESRSFYEELPDLTSMVPLNLLGLTAEQAQVLRDNWKASKETRYTTPGKDEDDSSTKLENNDANEIESYPNTTEDEPVIEEDNITSNEPDSKTNDEVSASSPSIESNKLDNPGAKVNALLNEKLLECTTKVKCDEFCVNYCYLINKLNKNKLILALSKIPYGRSELISNYARIIATFNRIFPNFYVNILSTILSEIYYIIKSKSILTFNQIDNKSKTFKYLSELIKFNIIPPITVFKIFKLLLDDFSSHNIEFMCVLLESCGRYLYLLSYTHKKMEEILELMLRARRSKSIELRLQSAIDSAYFTVKPTERTKTKKKELSQIQRYVRYLLLVRLFDSKVSVDDIISSLRRLPYSNPTTIQENSSDSSSIEATSNTTITNAIENIEFYIVKYSLKISKQKYMSISTLADCLSGLMKYRPNVMIRLIDTVIENILLGLEVISYKRDYQRLIGLIKLIGELYNYQVISSAFIFDLLYFLINYGHNKPNENEFVSTISPSNQSLQSLISNNSDSKQQIIKKLVNSQLDITKYDITSTCEIDPSYDLLRAQLVVELINTCGEYYMKGFLREKLNNFLIYFQYYLLHKVAVPLPIEFSILDMFDQLDIHAKEADSKPFIRYSSIEELQPLIEAMELKIKESFGIAQDENEEEVEDEERESNRSKSNEDDTSEVNDDDEAQNSDDEDNSFSQFEAAKLLDKLRVAEEEDEEFNKAFKSVMMESIESATRTTASTKADIDRMAIPAVLPKPKNLLRPVISPNQTEVNSGKNGVVFKLLARDTKGRIETRQLCVPDDNNLVVKLQKSEEINRLEKQRIKEKVLLLESMNDELSFEDGGEEGGNVSSSSTRGRAGGRGRGTRPQPIIEPDSNSTGIQSSSARMSYYRRQNIDDKKPIDTLNLDEFLAETKASDIRKLQESQQLQQQQQQQPAPGYGNRRR